MKKTYYILFLILFFYSCSSPRSKEQIAGFIEVKTEQDENILAQRDNEYNKEKNKEGGYNIFRNEIPPDSILYYYKNYFGSIDSIKLNDKVLYIIEGDLVVDKESLLDHMNLKLAEEGYFTQHAAQWAQDLYFPKLMIRAKGSKRLILENHEYVPFAIDSSSFKNDSLYKIIKNAISVAVENWNNLCAVKFVHLKNFDAQITTESYPPELFFKVQYLNTDGKFVASSFFPHYKNPKDRIINIDPSYFTSKYEKVGILRHELGHIMGFLHEHLRAGTAANCPDEASAPYFDLTPYDPKSVMHYYCKTVGFGSYNLNFTYFDSTGAVKVYPR